MLIALWRLGFSFHVALLSEELPLICHVAQICWQLILAVLFCFFLEKNFISPSVWKIISLEYRSWLCSFFFFPFSLLKCYSSLSSELMVSDEKLVVLFNLCPSIIRLFPLFLFSLISSSVFPFIFGFRSCYSGISRYDACVVYFCFIVFYFFWVVFILLGILWEC